MTNQISNSFPSKFIEGNISQPIETAAGGKIQSAMTYFPYPVYSKAEIDTASEMGKIGMKIANGVYLTGLCTVLLPAVGMYALCVAASKATKQDAVCQLIMKKNNTFISKFNRKISELELEELPDQDKIDKLKLIRDHLFNENEQLEKSGFKHLEDVSSLRYQIKEIQKKMGNLNLFNEHLALSNEKEKLEGELKKISPYEKEINEYRETNKIQRELANNLSSEMFDDIRHSDDSSDEEGGQLNLPMNFGSKEIESKAQNLSRDSYDDSDNLLNASHDFARIPESSGHKEHVIEREKIEKAVISKVYQSNKSESTLTFANVKEIIISVFVGIAAPFNALVNVFRTAYTNHLIDKRNEIAEKIKSNNLAIPSRQNAEEDFEKDLEEYLQRSNLTYEQMNPYGERTQEPESPPEKESYYRNDLKNENRKLELELKGMNKKLKEYGISEIEPEVITNNFAGSNSIDEI